jgi:hypothetical protein
MFSFIVASFSRNTSDDESDNERIPCEFCDALINVNDWKSHSVNKQYLMRLIIFVT